MFRDLLDPVDPTPWPPPASVDLKAFVRNLAPVRAVGAATSGEYRRVCEQVETQPVRVTAAPLPVTGFLDGVQRKALVGRVDGRDLMLVWVGAGAVADTTLLNLEERLAVLCSAIDVARVRDAGPDVPVVAFPELHPWAVAQAADDWVDRTRRALEVRALAGAPAGEGKVIVVDGSLPTESTRTDAVGVVKSALNTEWVHDPGLLPVEAGWRSPALRLPPARMGERARLTAFVRLRSAPGTAAWGFSLIRVEVYEDGGTDLLDAAAAMAVSQRQSLHSDDPRCEIQLRGMRRAEEVLKARSPVAIDCLA